MKEKIELDTARGVRDIPSEEMILRQGITDRLRVIFERYGFNPLETPAIETMEVLAAKFAAGEDSDAMKEIFKMKDQGNRKLGLRFDLTLPMCRYIAMNPSLKMPFKRYEIGRVYRDGPIKLGRTREFYQCDVDIIGTFDVIADAEIIKLALDVFKELGLDAFIEVNNRKILNGILEAADVPEKDRMACIISVDKLNKIGIKGVEEEFSKLGINEKKAVKILTLLEISKSSTAEKIAFLRKELTNEIAQEGLKEMEDLFSYLSDTEKKKVVFNISLARGLTYYTSTVFEGFLKDSEITSSICGGGRYDEMIRLLLQSTEKIPGTGISFGLVPIMEALKLKKAKMEKTVTKVFVIPIGKTKKEALEITQKMRDSGANADLDLIGRGISKNLNYANLSEIPYVIFVGEKELAEKKVKFKDMKTGEEELLSLDNVIKKLKNYK